MYRGRSYSKTDRARPAIPSNFGRSPVPPAPRRRPSDRFLRTLAGRGLACLGIGAPVVAFVSCLTRTIEA